ncbi:MAG: hypothetical protein ACLPTJ_06020 [Solirubrobacteraceae bacterium]
MRRSGLIAAALVMVAVAVAVGGCGATPPQASLLDAKRLDASTGAISTACGESYQLLAFAGPDRGGLARLEATAIAAARKLASVYVRDPAWFYQGETISEIVHDATSMLRSCRLGEAAAALVSATRAFSRLRNGKA